MRVSFPSKKSSSERTCPYWQWKRTITSIYGPEEKHSRRVHAARTIIFQRGNLNYLLVCFTQCTLFFSIRLFSIACLFAVHYLWSVCNEDKCCVVTHHVAYIRFPWLVYVRTYCVPIATLNQNKRSRLLYLGDAQITREVCRGREGNEKKEKVEILLSFPLSLSCFAEMPC